jgi:predicted nucleic acid-binding protein
VTFLLDTNIVCELRKGQRINPHVHAWDVATQDDEKYLSVLTLGEIRRGIERIRRRDVRQARALDSWLRLLVRDYDDRILAVDVSVAEEWGRLMDRPTLPVIDGLLAATALVHGLTLATRNVKDVAGTGVATVNPFAYQLE